MRTEDEFENKAIGIGVKERAERCPLCHHVRGSAYHERSCGEPAQLTTADDRAGETAMRANPKGAELLEAERNVHALDARILDARQRLAHAVDQVKSRSNNRHMDPTLSREYRTINGEVENLEDLRSKWVVRRGELRRARTDAIHLTRMAESEAHHERKRAAREAAELRRSHGFLTRMLQRVRGDGAGGSRQ